ncbi:MAG TPA: class I SAM-dependent methyltransferase [bacterium]|nr:class I SAM-dependent methyltransferase [bacterium]HPN29557.1 class I SAM-dependent methyltransferase [bacterium]
MSDEINIYHKIRVCKDFKRTVAWTEIARYLQKFININGTVLELGAGKCLLINNIKAEKRIAVDLLSDIENYAAPEVKTYSGDCSSLEFIENNSIDTVLSACLFEHLSWEKIDLSINEINRVLKKDGRLICILPNFKYNYKKYFDDYSHRTILTDISFSEFLLSKNFKIEFCFPRFLPDPSQFVRSNNFQLPFLKYIIRIYLNSVFKPFAELMLIVAKKQ